MDINLDTDSQEGRPEEERERIMRDKLNEQIRNELAALEQINIVHGSKIRKQLERTQLQKMRGIVPLKVALARRRSSFQRRMKDNYDGNGAHHHHHHHHHHQNKKKKKKRNSSVVVVGEFGEEGVKNSRQDNEEELEQLRDLAIVKEKLKEKEKVRQLTMKFFKHRYILDRDSTQRSNTILVTGYEPSSGGDASAAELIRQQSCIVISNFLDKPSHTVLSKLSSRERDELERVVVKARGGRGGEGAGGYSGDEGEEEGGGGEEEGAISVSESIFVSKEVKKVTFLSEINDIQQQPLTELETTPSATPTSPDATPPPPLPPPPPPSPPPPPVYKRSSSYVSAMETEDTVTMETIADTQVVQSGKSRSPRSKPGSRSKRPFWKKLGGGIEREEKKKTNMASIKSTTLQMESTAMEEKRENWLLEEKEEEGKEAVKVTSAIVDIREEVGIEDDCGLFSPPDSPKLKPLSHHHPPPPPPPPTHRRLAPQYSITSLPSLDPKPTRYYATKSPRVDKVTNTYASEVNPFAMDFDRAMQEDRPNIPCSPPATGATPVTRSNTQLPDDITSDEGFIQFLRMHDAKPTTSMYITYQIQLISEQIDCKYSKTINQALESLMPELISQTLSWDNFSAICRSLLFKGEGFKDGLFMVPAFSRRLLGFLPNMHDVIMRYTQAVFEEYAMDWLLMRGGWGEVLRYQEQEVAFASGSSRQDDEAEASDKMWVWPAANDDAAGCWWAEPHGGEEEEEEEEEEEDMFGTAMGYGLVTPAPENEYRSLASAHQTTDDLHDNKPHPSEVQETCKVMAMGSDLFIAPVNEIAPPIGRGLRRVISVEVLFALPPEEEEEEDGVQEMSITAGKRGSIARSSSLPSISSYASLSSPLSLSSLSPRKHDQSTDNVFTLPSMRNHGNRPHPLDSNNLATPEGYKPQSSVEGPSIKLVGGASSPHLPPGSRIRSDSKPSKLITTTTTTRLVRDDGGTNIPNGSRCGQKLATPPQDRRPPQNLPTQQNNGIHDNRQTTPPTTGNNSGQELEPENGNWTQWSTVLILGLSGIGIAFLIMKKFR